jgi:hypothetical protein
MYRGTLCDDCDASPCECNMFGQQRRTLTREEAWAQVIDDRRWMDQCKEEYLSGASLDKMTQYHAMR